MNYLKTSAGLTASFFALLILIFGTQVFVTSLDVGEKNIKIERGMNALEIADLLEGQNIIKGKAGFVVYVAITGNFNRLQAGDYSFKGEYSTYQVADIISSGLSLSSQKTVFIPEGFTVSQIDIALEEAGVEPIGKVENLKISDLEDEFPFLSNAPGHIESLEGFLFPDTYRFKKRSPANVIARRMLENFESKTKNLREEISVNGSDLYDVLTIASILEKEVPVKDMSRASGVIEKRLEAGMFLQLDATLVYVLGRPIKRSDIDSLNSLYNTYKYSGLPPTPISNPGVSSIESALYPEDNSFWYYLSRRDTGETIFSRTFTEHDSARAKYLQ